MEIESFKLRLRDTHVRVLPKTGLQGKRFAGPGVDLLGADAVAIIRESEGFIAWARARDSTCEVRSVSVQLEPHRVTISLDDVHQAAHGKPQVIRIGPPESSELMDVAQRVLPHLIVLTRQALERRISVVASASVGFHQNTHLPHGTKS
jgi:hypothetical protein